MRKLLFASVILGLSGLGLGCLVSANAAETADQAAAEGFVTPASPPPLNQTRASPDNGLAQHRTVQTPQDILPQNTQPQQ